MSWPTKKLGEILFRLLPHKQWTREIRKKIKKDRIAYNKNLITLASGAILLTFTIIQILSDEVYSKMAIKISWGLFGVSIIFGLIAHAFIIHEDIFWFIGVKILKNDKTVKNLSDKEKKEFFSNILSSIGLAKSGYFLELGQLISFLIAIVFLMIFLFNNF